MLQNNNNNNISHLYLSGKYSLADEATYGGEIIFYSCYSLFIYLFIYSFIYYYDIVVQID